MDRSHGEVTVCFRPLQLVVGVVVGARVHAFMLFRAGCGREWGERNALKAVTK